MGEERKTRIFGLEPDQLGHLFSVGMNGRDAAETDTGPSASAEGASQGAAGDSPCFAASFVSGVEQVGQWIGPYHLVRTLGEGGMGIVYLAEQEHPIRRQVALKVIKPGMDSRRIIHRFRTEEQTLALLHHPNIAQVLDAGTTDTGRSYFVMEYVEGVPITDYCDRHALTVTDRLSLFQQVCHGIHHAHQKGIVHRDIKPSNVLVCVEQDMPIPKIIDFGIAKAISRPVDQQTWFTRENQPVGTPEFMSPEQLEMTGRDIDIRSDIYSLGVLLYVLLTGVRPFDWENLRAVGIDHVRRMIREQDPKTPSTRITRLGSAAAEIANCRHTEVHTLIRRLRRELEWIPLKAMRKERAARYRSAAELADDIDNYMRGRPLLAGPPTTIYRLKKFVRRHRALVIGIAAVLAVSLIGTLVSAAFAVQAKRARDDAQAIAYFLENDVLGSVSRARIGEATVSYVLDAASERLDERFRDRPLVEASIRWTLAWTYRELGESQKAEHHALRAIGLYERHLGREHATTRDVRSFLVWIYEDQGRYQAMEDLCVELGLPPQTAVARYHLGKYREAIASLVDQRPRIEKGGYPFLCCNLARAYAALGQYDEAETLFLDTLAGQWPEDTDNWKRVYAGALAEMYREQGRYDEAEACFRRVLQAQRLDIGEAHVHTLATAHGLIRLFLDIDRLQAAERVLRQALPIARRHLRREHPLTLRLTHACGILQARRDEYDKAQLSFTEALEGRRRQLGEDHPDTLESKHDLGLLYMQQACYEEAEPLLLDALHGREVGLGAEHPHTQASLKALIALYESIGCPEETAYWRARLAETSLCNDDSPAAEEP